MYIPDQGDLIWLTFDPSSGKEIIKRRPAFVISRKLFNQHTKMAVVAPITSKIKGIKLEVVLAEKNKTSGAILVYQLKTVDFIQRNAEFIEKTSANTIEQVLAIAQLIIS